MATEVNINVQANTRRAQSAIEGLSRKSRVEFKRMGLGGTSAFTSIGTSAKGLITKLTSIKGLLISYGALRLFGGILSESRGFETALSNLTKVTTESLDDVKAKILALDSTLGTSTDLVNGYYQAISSGVTDPAKALELLITAAKASKGAHVDQSEVIKGLTKIMTGFEGQIKSTTEAADLLFNIEAQGQTTFGELIPVVGELAKVSSDMGISSQEMAGALAIVTQTAGNTMRAASAYRAMVNSLVKPTDSLKIVLGQLAEKYQITGEASSAAIIKQIGLVPFMKELETATGGSAQKLADLLGSQEGFLAFSKASVGGFDKITEAVDKASHATGGLKKAFAAFEKTGRAKDESLIASLGKLKIALGDAFGPIVNEAIKGITVGTEGIAKAIEYINSAGDKFSNIVSDIIVNMIQENTSAEIQLKTQKEITKEKAKQAGGKDGTAGPSRDFLSEVRAKSAENIKDIIGAFDFLKVQSSGQLIEMADKAVAAFITIKDSGVATSEDILRAYQAASGGINAILEDLKGKQGATVEAPNSDPIKFADDLTAASKKGYSAIKAFQDKRQKEWDDYWKSKKFSEAPLDDIKAVEDRLKDLTSAFNGISTGKTFSPTIKVSGIEEALSGVKSLKAELAGLSAPVVIPIKGQGSAVLPISEKIRDIKTMFGSISEIRPTVTADFSPVTAGIQQSVDFLAFLNSGIVQQSISQERLYSLRSPLEIGSNLFRQFAPGASGNGSGGSTRMDVTVNINGSKSPHETALETRDELLRLNERV